MPAHNRGVKGREPVDARWVGIDAVEMHPVLRSLGHHRGLLHVRCVTQTIMGNTLNAPTRGCSIPHDRLAMAGPFHN
jgi:hypothetical protein